MDVQVIAVEKRNVYLRQINMNSTTKSDIDAPFLDEEEKDVVTGFETAIEGGRIPSQSLTEQEAVRTEWESVLENTQKRKAVTLRLQERDIKRVKTIAREIGMPYQTYLASVVHRIATGEIVIR